MEKPLNKLEASNISLSMVVLQSLLLPLSQHSYLVIIYLSLLAIDATLTNADARRIKLLRVKDIAFLPPISLLGSAEEKRDE